MAEVPPDKRVEEIPFDIAEWGDRVVQPLFANDLERRRFEREDKASPEFRRLRRRARRLERERLARG